MAVDLRPPLTQEAYWIRKLKSLPVLYSKVLC